MPNDLPDWTSRVQLPPVEPIAQATVDVGSATVTAVLVAGVAGKRIELAQLMLVAGGTGNKQLRGIIFAAWSHGPIPLDFPFAYGAISPEAPSLLEGVAPGAMLSDAGEDLNYLLTGLTTGQGTATVLIAALYRLI